MTFELLKEYRDNKIATITKLLKKSIRQDSRIIIKDTNLFPTLNLYVHKHIIQ